MEKSKRKAGQGQAGAEDLNTSDRVVEMLDSTIRGLSKVIRSPPVTKKSHPTIVENVAISNKNSSSEKAGTVVEGGNAGLIEALARTVRESQNKQAEFFEQMRYELQREIRDQQEKQISKLQQLEIELRQNLHSQENEQPREIPRTERREQHRAAFQTATTNSPDNSPNNRPRNINTNQPATFWNNFDARPPSNPENQFYAPRPCSIKPMLPTFEGLLNERPPKFIRELELFIRVTGVQDFELPMIISQALKGIANEWWDFVSERISNWNDFVREFLRHFGSETIQKRVRVNLERGWYRENSGRSRVNYAMRIIGNGKDLSPPKPEEEIVTLVARLFSRPIIDSIITQDITTIDQFLRLLDRWDNGGYENGPLYRNQEQNIENVRRPIDTGGPANPPPVGGPRGNSHGGNVLRANYRPTNNLQERNIPARTPVTQRPGTQANMRTLHAIQTNQESEEERPCDFYMGDENSGRGDDLIPGEQHDEMIQQYDPETEQEDPIDKIQTVYADLRQDLLQGREKEAPFVTFRSPEVKIHIEGIPVTALLDTGSTVTAVSEEWYLKNAEKLTRCPALPMTGTCIIGATAA